LRKEIAAISAGRNQAEVRSKWIGEYQSEGKKPSSWSDNFGSVFPLRLADELVLMDDRGGEGHWATRYCKIFKF
jgi:hypothetical protein